PRGFLGRTAVLLQGRAHAQERAGYCALTAPVPATSAATSPLPTAATPVLHVSDVVRSGPTVVVRVPCGVVTETATGAPVMFVTRAASTTLPATHRVSTASSTAGGASTTTVASTGIREASWAMPRTVNVPAPA